MPKIVMMKTRIPHVYRMDLDGSGLARECAVLKIDAYGSVFYIDIATLDEIDRTRLSKVLNSRWINEVALWDIMSQTTLNNGINCLDYMHQMVRAVTSDGVEFNPTAGAGIAYNVSAATEADMRNADLRAKAAEATKANAAAAQAELDLAKNVKAQEPEPAPEPAKKSPGRPKKSTLVDDSE